MITSLPLQLECPYCGVQNSVPAPKGIDKVPLETACMPYTRDIGRFDFKGWSRIGKDYLRFLFWERIGIIQVTRKNLNVQYRVQECVGCEALFDVYVNYNPDNTSFSKLWPHLFGEDSQNSTAITPYLGESLIIKLIRSLGKIFKSKLVGSLVLGIIAFSLGFFPNIAAFRNSTVSFELPLHPTLAKLVSDVWSTQTLYIGGKAIFYGLASLGIVIMFSIAEQYVTYMQGTKEFDSLYAVENKAKGIVHWKNFSIARFVGVQGVDSFPRPSQVDVVAGGIGIVLAFISWAINFYHMRWYELSNLLIVFPNSKYQLIIAYITELLFGVLLAYVLAVTIWLALSITFYILNGLRRIPMNLSVYDSFSLARPLRKLENYSISAMLAAFIVILIVATSLQTVVRIDWVFSWLQWALALLFVSLGFGLGRGEYIGIALLYISLVYLVPDEISIWHNQLFVDGQLLTLGAFFTTLLAFQLYSANRYVNGLLQNAKDKEMTELSNQVENFKEQLAFINQKIQANFNVNVGLDNRMIELHSQRQLLLESMESTLRILVTIRETPVSRGRIKDLSKVFSPVITSFILPLLFELAIASVVK